VAKGKNQPANASDRPVMLSADSARRVGRMLQAYEGGDRAIKSYVTPDAVVSSEEILVKYFKLNAVLEDCHHVEGTEVTATMNLETHCLGTSPVVPANVVTLYELSFLVTRHNIAKNKKLDTKLPVDAVVQCMAFPGGETPAQLIWRIVEILDCGCGSGIIDPSEPWCKIIGGVYLDELDTVDDATYGLVVKQDGCIGRDERGCTFFSGLSTADLSSSSTPVYVIGVDAAGCLCKVPVAPCVPSAPPSPGG